MALNITSGNDIQLRLLVTRDSAPFPIDLATGVQVNVVSIFNRRIPLEFQISDGAVYVTVRALHIGTYGIEVKGLLNRFNWRTYADAAIVVTSSTKAGDTSVTVASDVYDVTMEVSMYVGTLPLNNGGTYVDGISVLKGYFYAFDGSTYLALVNSPTTAPSETSDEWALLARKGHDFSYSDFTPEQISALQKPATDALAEMNTLKTNVETSEATRVENENTRVTNEATRVTDEATRVTNENGRVESEQARATNEENRSAAEATRVANEENRQIKEVERDNTEKAIISDWKDVISSLNWYGNEWDMSVQSPDGTRIGNMDLHRLLPIHNMMEGVLLDDNGNEVQKLNSLSWVGQDRSGVSGQVMVKIPNFYFKFEFDGDKFRFKILNQVPTIGKTFPGWNQFFDNSVDYVYCSAYEATLDRSNNKLCSVVNPDPQFRGGDNTSDWDGTYRSLLGRPVTNLTREDFRNFARARNTANTFWNQYIYTIHVMLSWLFYSEYNTLNSQKDYNAQLDVNGYKQGGLGKGVSDMPDWNGYNGYNPFVQCGVTDSLGNISGVVNCNVLAADGSTVYYTAQVPRYRGIENPFGHLYKWTDGINIKNDETTVAYVTTHTSKFSDSSYDGYENRGKLFDATKEGWITRMLLGTFGDLLPTNAGGSSSTFWCDYGRSTTPAQGNFVVVLSGGAAEAEEGGFGYMTLSYMYYMNSPWFGTRLCFVKQA